MRTDLAFMCVCVCVCARARVCVCVYATYGDGEATDRSSTDGCNMEVC